MHKTNWWLVGGMLLVGFGICFFSLYTASISGLKRQLGLVGGDLRQNVDAALLYRGIIEFGTVPQCDYWQSIAPVPSYVFANGSKKLLIGNELAQRRVVCAIDYTLAGNIERGVYTLLKSLRYYQSGLLLLEREIEQDSEMCELLQSSSTSGYIEAYLEASNGAVRGIVEREYTEMQRLMSQVIQRCEE